MEKNGELIAHLKMTRQGLNIALPVLPVDILLLTAFSVDPASTPSRTLARCATAPFCSSDAHFYRRFGFGLNRALSRHKEAVALLRCDRLSLTARSPSLSAGADIEGLRR